MTSSAPYTSPSLTTSPRRTAPFDQEPGFYEPARLWFYGNTRLLGSDLTFVEAALGQPCHTDSQLAVVEKETERLVLAGRTLVTGIHNNAHQRAAVVPLRWGAPRILVLHGGFYSHLGPELREEPFKAARLWRYEFDAQTDLLISPHHPNAVPSRRKHIASLDRLIRDIVSKRVPGLLFM